MKTTFTNSVKKLTCILGLTISATAIAQIPTNGLVAHWSFTGNANDETTNQLNGTVSGATLTSDRFGVPNRAYHFSSISKIEINDNSLLSFTDNTFAFSFWVKTNGNNTNDLAFFGKSNGKGNTGFEYLVRKVGSSNSTLLDQLAPITWDLAGSNYPYLFSSTDYTSTTKVVSNTWEHWVITADGTNMKAYKNGSLQFTYLANLPVVYLQDGTGKFTIGKGSTWQNDYFMDGDMDDFRVYDHELTPVEITALANEGKVAPFSLGNDLNICLGSSATLTSTFNANYNYDWYKDGVLLTNDSLNSLQISAAIVGTCTYVLNVTNLNGDSKSDTINVTTQAYPVTPIISGNQGNMLCAGQSATLSTDFDASYSYQWQMNGANISGAMNNTLVTNSAATVNVYLYNVIVTNQYGCTSTSASSSISVKPNPTVPTVTTNPSTAKICAGQTITLSTPPNSAGTTIAWYASADPSTVLSATLSYSMTPSISGGYFVTKTSAGCSTSSLVKQITVNSVPDVVITTDGPTNICNGDSKLLTATSSSTGTYQWYKATVAIAGSTANTYTAAATGAYKTTLTDVNGCKGTSNIITVNVAAAINAVITPTVTLTASAGTSYLWSTGETTKTIKVPLSVASYSVTVFGSYGCSATTCINLTGALGCNTQTAFVKNVPVEIVEQDASSARLSSGNIDSKELVVYPNPTAGSFIIQFTTKESSEYDFIILNSLGTQVYKNNQLHLESGKNEISFEDLNLESGVYIIQVSGLNYKESKRIVVAK